MRTDDPQLHYETIESRARPARVAVLIDSSDIDWHYTGVRIIEFLSSIWGGKHSVIVPTDGSNIEPVFWAILERFSPDFVYLYRKTGADIKISRHEEYAALLQQRIEQYGTVLATLEHENGRIDKELQNTWADVFGLSPDLCAQIVNRLVPFHFENNIHPVTSQGIPHELTGIADVLPYVNHARAFASFRVPENVDELWWAAHTGAYSRAVSEQLRGVDLNEELIQVSTDQLGNFGDWIAGGALPIVRGEIHESLGGNPGFIPPDETQPSPFDLSMSSVGLYGSPLSHRAFADRFAFVLGDSLSDFCLSYCLPRVGHRAVWLPSRWVDELRSKKDDALRSCIFSVVFAAPTDVHRGTGIKVCSQSRETAHVIEAL